MAISHIAASSGSEQVLDGVAQPAWTWFPGVDSWKLRADATYLHFCGNETIGGVEFSDWPDMAALGASDVPLVVDASSHFLSRPMDLSQGGHGVCRRPEKCGPAGLTMVIVRKDLVGHALPICPSAFDYANVAGADSVFNTPPTYAIYIAGLVFKWLKKQGGMAAIEAANIAKSKALYSYLDTAATSIAVPFMRPSRSRMNVPFFLRDESLNSDFLAQADAAGLMQLKGHKSVGGMRASIYNAVPIEGVQALVAYMQDFERRHG